MAKENALWHKVYFSDVHREVCKLVGYVGFPVRELAARSGDLRRRFKPAELSQALTELLSFLGNRVMLRPEVREVCWQLLGPPPEKWDSWYRNADGTPTPRPAGRETPPVVPEREIDPITDGLRLLTYTDLVERLQKARRIRDEASNRSHLRDNALETIPCVESEMVRRGMEIPPGAACQPDPKSAKRSGRKKK